MKFRLFLAATTALAGSAIVTQLPAASAATADLLISEYVEGSSFNKAIEIYNGTGAAVDLSAYSLELYSNGAPAPSQSTPLSGTLADGDVFVIAHASADPAVLAVADATDSSVVNFNGDDGVVLRTGTAIVDAFGQNGVDPGSEWPGGGQDDTLRRKTGICAGDTDFGDAFDVAVQWDVYAPNTFDGLGSHVAECGAAPDPVINEFSASTTGIDIEYVEIYGEPSADLSNLTVIQIEGDGPGAGVVDSATVVGALGPDGFGLLSLSSNTLENGTITLLLVDGFTGSSGTDLDTDNDGVFDATPWAAIVDAVAVLDGNDATDRTYGVPVLGPNYDGVATFPPGGASRIPDGADTDTAADWVRNDFDLYGIPGFPGTPIVGEAINTPGAPNQVYELPKRVINEFSASTAGADVEYVEIYGEPLVDLSNLTVLEIEGDSGATTGTIDEVIPVGTTDAAGLQLLSLPANTLENGTITLLLVDGFVGALGDDLDADDDGALDVMPWAGVVDSVAVNDGGAGDLTYGVPVLGPNYDGLISFAPGGASRIPDGADTDTAADWVRNDFDLFGIPGFAGTPIVGEAVNTPGAPNELVVPPTTGFCGDPATLISEIQGDGPASPLVGQTRTIEGVVVGDFQDGAAGANGDLNGFHVQEEDADSDGNPATSEGIFVFDGSSPAVDVNVGDRVRVIGAVSEFNGLTEISATGVLLCGPVTPPTPAVVTLPVDSFDDYEAVEGMSVVSGQDLYISEYFNFDRFGEIVLTPERLYQPTAIFDPGSADAAASADLNARSRLTLDDGRTNQNPDPARHPNGADFTLDNRFRGGDILQDVAGVMDFAFGLYRIQPTAGATYVEANPRPVAPDDVGGSLTVASFNVLNYFHTLDDGVNDICGPLQDQECRGADDANERARQLAKIVAAMSVMDADVLGIIEVENTPDVEAMADIVDGLDGVDGLNDLAGFEKYAYIETGVFGTDPIKQGFIYQPGTVTPVGDLAVLDDPAFVRPFGGPEDFNRPAYAQTFVENATGGVVTVVVNHLKSKGSACGPGDDDPEAGSCNLTRTVSAKVLADWLAGDPTGSGDADVLIIGDLNSYDEEDPIDVLTAAGYADLLLQYEGELAYSYVFDSQLGYLDYGMANASLASQVTGATAWHINADEPDLLDYDTTFKRDAQDAIFAPDPYRASDHDPVIVGLDLNASPVCTDAFPSIDTIWSPNHKMVDVEILGVTDAEDDPITITIDAIFQDEAVNGDDDGNTAPDGAGVGASIAQVRAERSGEGDGRVYHIAFTATDAAGGGCSGEVVVTVPLSRRSVAVDGGALHDSTVVPAWATAGLS